MSADSLAASQIVGSLEGVGNFGLMGTATVLTGKALGAGDAEEAQVWLRRLTRSGLVTALGSGLVFALGSLLVPELFPKVGRDVQHIAQPGVLVTAAQV